MEQPIFITGIGTGVGKTLAAAIVTEALQADYWKPVQAGIEDGTDTRYVQSLLNNTRSVMHPETYRLSMAASPHIAAGREGVQIDLGAIVTHAAAIRENNKHKMLVVEGAGGLLVPLNATEKVADLIKALDAKVIIVSRNYLGSINHSLLTADFCRNRHIDVLGWIFNDDYLSYESEIVSWSGYPSLGNIPALPVINKEIISALARTFHAKLMTAINHTND